MTIVLKKQETLIKKTQKKDYCLLGTKNRRCDLVAMNKRRKSFDKCCFMNTYALTALNFVKKSQQGKLSKSL